MHRRVSTAHSDSATQKKSGRCVIYTCTLLCEIPAEHLNPVAASTATLISSTITAPMVSCRSGQSGLSKDSDDSHSCKPRCRSSSTKGTQRGSTWAFLAEPSKGVGNVSRPQRTAPRFCNCVPTARTRSGHLKSCSLGKTQIPLYHVLASGRGGDKAAHPLPLSMYGACY